MRTSHETRLASLPMYDLPEVVPAVEGLWSDIAARLTAAGVPDVPTALRWGGDLYDDHWLHPQLLLSQSCGWPLVDRLAGRVAVVGAFTYAGVSDAAASYRSVLVTRSDDVDRPLAGRRVAVNGYDSLSGWLSLGAAVRPLGPVLVTGAHVHSVAAVTDGRADLACIDGVTWNLLERHRPAATASLTVVGHGPVILCLPLVAHHTRGPGVEVLRAALAGVSDDTLGIDGFVPLDAGDYEPTRHLRPGTVSR
jgi:ABC-type phosphate/phosphonate transport system substrate-binding protein